jgi:hypothetical protein
MLPIKINVGELVSEFNISKNDIDDLREEILSGLVNTLYYYWQKFISESRLRSNTKEKYSVALDKFKEGRFKGGVGIMRGNNLWLINAIEDGIAVFDMKTGMLKSSKAKIGKLGQTYITIPFRIGTPGTGFAVTMSDPTYQIAKALKGKQQVKQFQLTGNDAAIRTRPIIKTQTKIFDAYQHQSSIFTGIQKGQGKYHGQYNTFRRISNAPQPMGSDLNSWIHRGIQAYKLADKAIEKTKESNLVDKITDDFLNQKFG